MRHFVIDKTFLACKIFSVVYGIILDEVINTMTILATVILLHYPANKKED